MWECLWGVSKIVCTIFQLVADATLGNHAPQCVIGICTQAPHIGNFWYLLYYTITKTEANSEFFKLSHFFRANPQNDMISLYKNQIWETEVNQPQKQKTALDSENQCFENQRYTYEKGRNIKSRTVNVYSYHQITKLQNVIIRNG